MTTGKRDTKPKGYSTLEIRKQQDVKASLDAIAKRILQSLEDGSIRGDMNVYVHSKTGPDWICSVAELKRLLTSREAL